MIKLVLPNEAVFRLKNSLFYFRLFILPKHQKFLNAIASGINSGINGGIRNNFLGSSKREGGI